MPSSGRVAKGKQGEDLACRELQRRGYLIVERRYRTRFGEIDIVARDGRTTVFVEVKMRSSCRFGSAAEAVTWHKRHRICAMASEYVLRHHLAGEPCRFDVVTVEDGDGGRPRVDVLAGAFGVNE